MLYHRAACRVSSRTWPDTCSNRRGTVVLGKEQRVLSDAAWGWCLAFKLSESLLGQLHTVLMKSNHTNECEDARNGAKSSVDITVLFLIILQFTDPYLHFDVRLRECHSLFVKISLISQAPDRGVNMA